MDTKHNAKIISDVKTVKTDFSNLIKDVETAYGIKFSDTERAEIISKIPRYSNSITYKARVNTSLANGWRRVMLDETPYPRFAVKMDDIQTDDPFCQRMTDYIQNRIWLVPISYIPPGEDIKGSFMIDVKNESKDTITVTTRDIKAKGDVKIEWDQNTELFELNSSRFAKIPLSIEWGINLTHASYSIVGPVRYKALDITPPAKSYAVHPNHYELGCTVVNLVDPLFLSRLAWQTLLAKIRGTLQLLTAFAKNNKMPYQSPLLKVTVIKGNRIRYEFINETYTISNILAWYGYNVDRSISYIHAGDDHPEDRSALVKITHPEHCKILQKACDAAIVDIESVLAELHV